jgi:hypothetical protein
LNDILEHDLVQGQIGDDALQPRILLAQLLELRSFTVEHRAIRLLSSVERLLGDPDLAADVANGDLAGRLLQDRGDLLGGESLLLHGTPSRADWPDCAAELTVPLN